MNINIFLGEIFNAEWLNNPLVGLMIGVLGTVLVQSSSTFTSIIVAAIGESISQKKENQEWQAKHRSFLEMVKSKCSEFYN